MTAESLQFHGIIDDEPGDVKLKTFEWLALYSESIFDQPSADFRRSMAREYSKVISDLQEPRNVQR